MSSESHDWDEVINNVIAPRAIEAAERFTVPIFYVDDPDEGIKRDRTGVLYTIAGRHFILTAAHRLREIASTPGIESFLNPSDRLDDVLPLSEITFHYTEVDGRDIAVIALNDELVAGLKMNKEFLNHSDICLKDESKSSLYVLYGYPAGWTVRESDGFSSMGFGLSTSRHTGKHSETAFYDPNVNIRVWMKDRPIRVVDRKVETFRTDDMKGISGAGIWRVVNALEDSALKRWQPNQISLCAIQHRWHGDRDYAQGTWVAFALDLIQENYPDTRAAMNLIYKRS